MEKSSFFNSINGDRRYKAEAFAEYFASFIGNGIFPNPSNNLQVISNNNLTVTVQLGKAWINGYFYVNTNELKLKIDVSDAVLNRVDRVVLRLDNAKRDIHCYVKKGKFENNPTSLELQRDADAYELALADIYIKAGAISIVQNDITDLRLNKELCGIVHGVVNQVDVTTLFNQYTEKFKLKEEKFETEFKEWIEELKDVLKGDVAGNLLNLINKNKKSIEEINTEFKSELANITQQINDIDLSADKVTLNSSNFSSNNVKGALEELFTNASNSKNALKEAITGLDKDINMPQNPTFEDIINSIKNINVSPIKRIIRGSFSRENYPNSTASIKIPEIDINKSISRIVRQNTDNFTLATNLINETTLKFDFRSYSSNPKEIVYWEVIEFNNAIVQRGIVSPNYNNNINKKININTINPLTSIAIAQVTSSRDDLTSYSISIANKNTIEAQLGAYKNLKFDLYWQVIDFK